MSGQSAVDIACSSCGKNFRVPNGPGHRVRCPYCRTLMPISIANAECDDASRTTPKESKRPPQKVHSSDVVPTPSASIEQRTTTDESLANTRHGHEVHAPGKPPKPRETTRSEKGDNEKLDQSKPPDPLIEVTCDECFVPFTVDTALAGQDVKCTSCGAMVHFNKSDSTSTYSLSEHDADDDPGEVADNVISEAATFELSATALVDEERLFEAEKQKRKKKPLSKNKQTSRAKWKYRIGAIMCLLPVLPLEALGYFVAIAQEEGTRAEDRLSNLQFACFFTALAIIWIWIATNAFRGKQVELLPLLGAIGGIIPTVLYWHALVLFKSARDGTKPRFEGFDAGTTILLRILFFPVLWLFFWALRAIT